VVPPIELAEFGIIVRAILPRTASRIVRIPKSAIVNATTDLPPRSARLLAVTQKRTS
jgi:hypothetical protein